MRVFLIVLSLVIHTSGCNLYEPEESIVEEGGGSNTLPSISSIAMQSITENRSTSFNVIINDFESTLNCNTALSASSSNTSLIGNSDVVFSGVAPNCSAILTPIPGESGVAEISINVTDGELSSSSTFTLSVSFNPGAFDNLELWLDASDSSTIFQDSFCTNPTVNNTEAVACWLDKGGKGNNATVSSPAQTPVIDLTTNIASISFDGINDFYDDERNYNAKSVYILYRVDSTKQQGTDLGQLWGEYDVGHVAIDGRDVGLWSFDGVVDEEARYGINGGSFTPPSQGSDEQPWVNNQFGIIKAQFVNNIPITRQVLGSLFPNFPIGTHQFGGQISEVIVYSTDIALSDEQRIEGYLSCKWDLQASLPLSHPYRSTCP